MAVYKWSGAWASRGAVLTTQLNSLAAGAASAVGPTLDNSVNLDQWAQLELALTFAVAPAAGDYVSVYLQTAPDGANFEAADQTQTQRLVASVPVQTVLTAQKLHSRPFLMEPARTQFWLVNNAGQALSASGNTATVYTANEASF